MVRIKKMNIRQIIISKSNRTVLPLAVVCTLGLSVGAIWSTGAFAVGFSTSSMQGQVRKSTDPPVANEGKLGQDLFLAIDHRNVLEVKALIKRGADVNARNGLQFVPLYIAAASYQLDVMMALLEAGADPEAGSVYGTPLTFASITGNQQGAKILLDKGVAVNKPRTDGKTALMMASFAGNPALVAELIQSKADVTAKSASNATALSFAAAGGHVEAGRMLIEAGADIEGKDERGQTPLMLAAIAGHTEFVQLLLQKGAKPDAQDGSGQTALMKAASFGNYPETVQALTTSGANAGLKDSKGRTASDFATVRGFKESASILGASNRTFGIRSAPDAATASLKALEISMKDFSKKVACMSCHQEGLGRMATASARNHGLKVDEKLNQSQLQRLRGAYGFMKAMNTQALKDPEVMKQLPLIEINDIAAGDSWFLGGMAAQNDPPNEATATEAMILARQQAPDGKWTFSLPRVPMQSSNFTYTALSVRVLQAYAPKARADEMKERLGRAKAWLLQTPAKSGDDRAFRLLGLKWSGSTLLDRSKAVEEIVAAQNPDGGWSQLPGMKSDAYATGQALYALRVGGAMPVTDAVYEKGVRLLLQTQDDDGTWFVNKRAIPANNYFDASFPHGESQYASFNGTCWALLAILETMPKK
jgi:ankyrin repeat protein